ncbi:MAG: hypothetical protein QMD11_01650 [Smithella sp.]|nr:hypothetical protein [Smithella sp.]
MQIAAAKNLKIPHPDSSGFGMTVFAIATKFLRRYDKTETYLCHAGLDPASRKIELWIAQ